MNIPLIPREFEILSKEIGENFQLIQAAGGNTSIKQGELMWIKASGKWLKNCTKDLTFVPVNTVTGKQIDNPPTNHLRPSIETPFHTALPAKVVFHVHCTSTLARTLQREQRAGLYTLLRDFNWELIDYVKPGRSLATKVLSAFNKKQADVFVLSHHGLIVTGDTPKAAKNLLDRVVNKMRVPPTSFEKPGWKDIGTVVSSTDWKMPRHEVCHAIANNAELFTAIKAGFICPDHAVFLSEPTSQKISLCKTQVVQTECKNPKNFHIVEKCGVLVSSHFSEASDEMLKCIVDVMCRVNLNNKIDYLSNSAVKKIVNWEAEKYRQSI